MKYNTEINYRKGDRSFNNDYTFVRRTLNDKPTKWWQVYSFVYSHPEGVSKREILDAVWPDRNNSMWSVIDDGYCSNLFSQMHCKDVIYYNKSTKKWYTHGNYGNPAASRYKTNVRVIKADEPVRAVFSIPVGNDAYNKSNAKEVIDEAFKKWDGSINSTNLKTNTCEVSAKIKLAAIDYIYEFAKNHYGKIEPNDLYNAFIAGANLINLNH